MQPNRRKATWFNMQKLVVNNYALGILVLKVTTTPPWTDAGMDRGHGGALIGAWPPAAPVRQSSPAGAQNREGVRGTWLGSHRSSGGTVEAGRRWCRMGRRRRSVRGRLERGEKRREAGRGAVNSGGGAHLL
jgi:hypothetical protein